MITAITGLVFGLAGGYIARNNPTALFDFIVKYLPKTIEFSLDKSERRVVNIILVFLALFVLSYALRVNISLFALHLGALVGFFHSEILALFTEQSDSEDAEYSEPQGDIATAPSESGPHTDKDSDKDSAGHSSKETGEASEKPHNGEDGEKSET